MEILFSHPAGDVFITYDGKHKRNIEHAEMIERKDVRTIDGKILESLDIPDGQ